MASFLVKKERKNDDKEIERMQMQDRERKRENFTQKFTVDLF